VLAVGHEICAAVAALGMPHAASEFGHVTVSIGVASIVPDGLESPESLVWKADKALYRAKNEGRNRVVLSQPPGPVIELPESDYSEG
jgi:diguanylate cyclase (GGDEF)-like protein